MAAPPPQLHIVTQVARQRVNGYLYAYQHASTDEQKARIIGRIGQEMQKTLDVMGVALDGAKDAFALFPLTPPTAWPRSGATSIAACLEKTKPQQAQLFKTAAKNFPKGVFNEVLFAAALKDYRAAASKWRAERHVRPEADTWMAWQDALTQKYTLLGDVRASQRRVDTHIGNARIDGVESADISGWKAETERLSLVIDSCFAEKIQERKAALNTKLDALKIELSAALKVWQSAAILQKGQHIGELKRVLVLAKAAIREAPVSAQDNQTIVAVIVDAEKKIEAAKIPVRPTPAPFPRPTPAPVPRPAPVPEPRPGPNEARLIAETCLPAVGAVAIAMSAQEVLKSVRADGNSVSVVTAKNTQTGDIRTINSQIMAHFFEINGDVALIADCSARKLEIIKARNGSFGGQPVLTASHTIAQLRGAAVFGDRAVLVGIRGELQVFCIGENSVSEAGAFTAHHSGIVNIAMGRDFMVTTGLALKDNKQPVAIWSNEAKPRGLFSGKGKSVDRFEVTGHVKFLAAHGQFMYYSTGNNKVYCKKIREGRVVDGSTKCYTFPAGHNVHALGVSDGLLAVSIDGAVQVLEAGSLNARSRIDLPGEKSGVVTPADNQVHVYFSETRSVKTFSTDYF